MILSFILTFILSLVACWLSIEKRACIVPSIYVRIKIYRKLSRWTKAWTVFLKHNRLREVIKVKKKKESVENSTLGSRPPCQCGKIQPDFLCFWHDSEQLWQKMYLPLNKVWKSLFANGKWLFANKNVPNLTSECL